VADRDPDCLFCKIVAGELPSQIVDSDERTISFMDINPATPGHALVIPRAHSADLYEVSEEDLLASMSAARRLALRMRETIEPGGINILNSCGRPAWQTVFHFHLHVVPRYAGDPLELPWLPSAGDPEEIAAVAERLRRQ
jgi:histidine triad (HIT) family protein